MKLNIFRNRNEEKDRPAENMPAAETSEPLLDSGQSILQRRSTFSPDELRNGLAPDGIDPNSLDYFYMNDMGQDVYVRTFYVYSVPSQSEIVETFLDIINVRGIKRAVSSVRIVPMPQDKAIRQLKNKLAADTSDRDLAKNDAERIRLQRLVDMDTLWYSKVESGESKIYNVGFLISVISDSLHQLKLDSAKLVSIAKERAIELSSCYGMQAEAYLSNGPYNRIYAGPFEKMGALPIKYHPFDQDAVSTLFCHTNSFFSHDSGICLGRDIQTLVPVMFNLFDRSHNGYSIAIAGATGTGKTLLTKGMASRYALLPGYAFACVDTEKIEGTDVSEYTLLCEYLGGVTYVIGAGSANKINLFEVDTQTEANERLGTEVPVLHLTDKVADIRNTLMTAIIGTKNSPDFSTATYMETILSECITALYAEKGIYDGQPDSLYTEASGEGILSSGKTKKMLPTVSEAYMWLLHAQRDNQVKQHEDPLQLLLDSVSDLVQELYYDADTLEQKTKEEYLRSLDTGNRNICKVAGTMGYFDGQSSFTISGDIPFINFDLSNLPKAHKLIGQEVAMGFLKEYFIEKNSTNKKKSQRRCLIADEAHRYFEFEPSRKFLAEQVKTVRKRNASLWTITQSMQEYDKYEETKEIWRNSAAKFVFKQDVGDMEAIQQKAGLTSAQAERLIRLGGNANDKNDRSHKGEVCLLDGGRVVFLKFDYLKASEWYFAESDAEERQRLMGREA